MYLILLLLIGTIGGILMIAGISSGVQDGFAPGSAGRNHFLLGLILFFLGFGIPVLLTCIM